MKKLLKNAVLLGLLAMTAACNEKKSEDVLTFHVQPLGDYTVAEAKNLAREMDSALSKMIPYYGVEIEVADSVMAIPEAFRRNRRFRADSLIRYEARVFRPKRHHYVMGVTHNDISCTHENREDWGVLGLSFCPGRESVISTHRVHPKRMLYKVACHEVLHSVGLKHCQQDSIGCVMRDAYGHPKLREQERLCTACAARLDSILAR